MDRQTQPRRSVPYSLDLMGGIRSHLAALQGYDIMALELIQNADDAKAEAVVFDITDQAFLSSIAGRSPTAATCIRVGRAATCAAFKGTAHQ